MPGRDHQRQRLLPLFDGQVRLGGQTATRPAQPMIVWFRTSPSGWLLLRIPVSSRTGGMLVRAGDGGIHRHIPGDQPLGIGSCL